MVRYFKTQAPAIEYMKENGHTILFKKSNYKFASVKSQTDLVELIKKTNKKSRCFYEVLLADAPQLMFAEFDAEELGMTDAEVYGKFEHVMIKIFTKVGLTFDPSKSRITVSSRGEKLSIHWVYLGSAFKNCVEQK